MHISDGKSWHFIYFQDNIQIFSMETSPLLTKQVFHIFAGKRFNKPFVVSDQVFG